MAAAALVVLGGCSGSSPRFRSEGSVTQHEPEEEVRFASKIREEETRGDDRKVDPAKYAADAAARSHTSWTPERTPAGLNRDRVLLEAVSFLGVPYAYGESSKNGMDCSGFTSKVYQQAVGLALPRSSRDQYREGKEVERDSLLFGDLVFFNTTGSGPSHVGIYLEDDLFAHASVSFGVTISSLQSTYYREKYFGARRVVPE